MKVRHIAILILLPFLTFGCPVGSKYPLSESNKSQVDERLLGSWKSIKQDKDSGKIYIWQFNENEYYMEIKGDNDNNINRVRAFMTVIDNVRILNTKELKMVNEQQEYVYIKYEISNDNILTFWTMDSKLLPKKEMTNIELFSSIMTNINIDKFYEKFGSFIRYRP